jgi:LysM repeat protein
MFWRGLYIAGVVLAGLGASGCLNSEADFQALLEEIATLSEELAEAHKENEILTRALTDIKREQETLQLLLNAGKRGLAAGRASRPLAALAPGEDQAAAATGVDEEEWQTPLEPAAEPAAAASAVEAPASEPAAAPAAPAAEAVAVQAAPAPAAPAARSSSGRYYVTKPGDVLSQIAQANQTTVAKLLELNPNLRNRRDYIIYNNERLRLP